MEKKLRCGFIYSLLAMVVGAADIALFWFRGIAIFHPFLGLLLLIAGFFLFVIALIKAIIALRELNKQTEKIKNQDKLYEKDNWVSYGGGLHQYRPHK